MKKVFVSQPMRDRSDKEIETERKDIVALVKKQYGEDVELLDTFFKGAPHDAAPLWFLGKSIQMLGRADIVVFAPGWDKYRGCRTEHFVCEQYGIDYLEMEA